MTVRGSRLFSTLSSILLLVLVAGCQRESAPAEAGAARASSPAEVATRIDTVKPTWQEEVAAWKQYRHDRLERNDGWLTLVGFAWLEPGENSVGSAPGSRVRLPAKAPQTLGSIRVENGTTTFTAAPGVPLTSEGVPITTLALASDRTGKATPIEHGSITFFVIERADRLAVRVRDREAETLKSFRGLEYWPLDPQWRLEARFEAASEVREVPVPNIFGFDERIASPGHVVLTVAGKEVRLLALDDTGDGRLFLVFGDETNGKETYGGGRFLYTDPPQDGKVVVDFNRAYNPPCVFTPYATCPLPPKENRLPFAVPAGEKKYALEAAHPPAS